MAESIIKADPEATASPGTADDDLEDAGDVEFWSDPHCDTMYLARIPAYVWQAWADLPDDAEIQIGRIRQWEEVGVPGQPSSHHLQLLLSSDVRQHRNLPKEYKLDVTEPNVKNTFIFSERDLTSYAAMNRERSAALAQGIPAHLLRQQQQQREQSQKQGQHRPAERGRKGRFQMNSRRAVPSMFLLLLFAEKTAFTGRIKHEINCTPLDNDETFAILANRSRKANQPKKQAEIMTAVNSKMVANDDSFGNFIKTGTQPEKLTKAKRLENKTARWEENRLLDVLADKFSEWRYWNMKVLKQAIPQPEAFLREQLDKIAQLHRSGPFANCWELKPGFQSMLKNDVADVKNGVAPVSAEGPGLESDEREDDVKMEDVL